MTTYVANLLSFRNPVIKCMDQSGCAAEFPGSELQRFLSEPLLKLWQRVNHRYRLELAGFAVEDCPSCDWACVVQDEDQQVLQCVNVEECGARSCRWCKKAVSVHFSLILNAWTAGMCC